MTGMDGVLDSVQRVLDEEGIMSKKLVQENEGSVLTALVTSEGQVGTGVANQSRRRFVKLNLFGLTLAPAASLFIAGNASAKRTGDSAPAALDPKDPQARALDYTLQSTKDQQSCGNCQLYTGSAGEEWGPCALFSYRVDASGKPFWVSSTGWCRGWAPRQS